MMFAVVFGVFGCSDSPEGKARKAMAESVEKAQLIVETKGDYEKALKEIKKAITLASRAGAAGEATFIVAGNLNFDYANQLTPALADTANAVNVLTDKLSNAAKKLSYLQIEKAQLESLMDSSDERVDQLEGLIKGSSYGPGIVAELAGAEERLFILQDEQEEFIAAERQAQEQITKIQTAATAKLNASKSASGTQKQQLEKEHYELVLAKKQYLVDAQAALDKVKEYQSQIAIVEPLVQKLQNDITDVERKIDDLDGSAQRSELKRQLRDNDGAIEAYETQIGQLSNSIKQQQGEYEKMLEQIDSLVDEAVKLFKKIKSRGNRDIASISNAEFYYAKATMNLSAMEHYKNIALRLQAISSSIENRSSGSVDRLAIQYSGSSNDHSEKAMEEYDAAIEEYQKLQKSAARGKDELACSITKSHILALIGKIKLADQLDKYEITEEAAEAVGELVEKAEQCDPDFAQSVTYKLFSGETDIVPAMQVIPKPEPENKDEEKKASDEKTDGGTK